MTAIPFVPADAAGHQQLGDWYVQAGRLMEAQAQYRTALALGLDDPGAMLRLAQVCLLLGQPEQTRHWCTRLETEAAAFLPDERANLAAQAVRAASVSLQALDHNRFARMRTLAGVLTDHGPQVRVLDIGGGDGLLALFLPEARYVLAEPGTNGLAAQALPFAAGEFDVVLACHVLEHIPAPERDGFLATLCGLARREVVLLNPFRAAGIAADAPDPWLELVWGLTRAPWAREHLDCGLPAVAEVQRFAAACGHGFRSRPDGMRAVATLHVLLSHYARLAGKAGDLEPINRLLNGLDPATLDSEALPTAQLVRLDVSGNQNEGAR